ncbi:hypothetical protein JAO29_14715 [Edaphobacter sp. HDX4]|uniref:hypothetical protein n=1 Tax=Edaphobacter sp. HDX4 TaxID=2794064 RepID=UPI002FE598D0
MIIPPELQSRHALLQENPIRTVTLDETLWQVVPKKPTFLMIEAGGEARDCEEA